MKAKLTIDQHRVLEMIQKSNPALSNLRVVVKDRLNQRGCSSTTFVIEADIDVAVPVLDGAK